MSETFVSDATTRHETARDNWRLSFDDFIDSAYTLAELDQPEVRDLFDRAKIILAVDPELRQVFAVAGSDDFDAAMERAEPIHSAVAFLAPFYSPEFASLTLAAVERGDGATA